MKKLIATAASIVIVISTSGNCNTYPAVAEVVDLDFNRDIVSVETATGIGYQFYGCEDYMVGDLVAMTMGDNGTADNILDDIVIDARYSGYYK